MNFYIPTCDTILKNDVLTKYKNTGFYSFAYIIEINGSVIDLKQIVNSP